MMNTAVAFIEQHWALLLTGATVTGSLMWLKLDARYAKKDDITRLSKGQDAIVKRLNHVEDDLKHLPTADDLSSLRLAVEELRGETKTFQATIRPINRLVDLLVENEVKKEAKLK